MKAKLWLLMGFWVDAILPWERVRWEPVSRVRLPCPEVTRDGVWGLQYGHLLGCLAEPLQGWFTCLGWLLPTADGSAAEVGSPGDPVLTSDCVPMGPGQSSASTRAQQGEESLQGV